MPGFTIDASEVRSLAIDLSGAPERIHALAPVAVKKTLFAIEADAKVLAPVDTGNLKSSIGTDVDGDGLGGQVGPTADYGDDVEYGTQPHIIRPNTAGALAFPGLGGIVFAQVVHHPGTAPQPYMGPAFDKNIPALEQFVGSAGEDAVL